MREIEIKASLKDKAAILQRLADKGVKMSPPIKQHDVVYGIPGAKDNAPDSVWLRIRTENDKVTIFTLKKQYKGGLDSIEHETEVTDAGELQEIIKHLGYELYSDLTKHRQKGKLGNIEICLDEIEGLGVFIEAEKMVALDSEGEAVVKELWRVFQDLGISRGDEVLDGYDVLMNQHLKE